jgi:hypothetical protein
MDSKMGATLVSQEPQCEVNSICLCRVSLPESTAAS